MVFNLFFIPSLEDIQAVTPLSEKCLWTPKDPIFYNIHTNLGVNYDAGHWFHMAENIMTYHSILRSKGQLANASQVYFNFDHAEFPTNLNGMTRFITYLGIASPRVHIDSLRYFSDKRLWHASKVGDTFLLDNTHRGKRTEVSIQIIFHYV